MINLEILKNIKQKLLLLIKDTYIYYSDNELEDVVNYIIKGLNILESKKEKGMLALEVQEGILHLVENFNDGYIIWLKIPLQNREDYQKIYNILMKKLNLSIGLHHSYGISNGGFNYGIFINNRIIELISDDEYDKDWLKKYYQRDNISSKKSLKK